MINVEDKIALELETDEQYQGFEVKQSSNSVPIHTIELSLLVLSVFSVKT